MTTRAKNVFKDPHLNDNLLHEILRALHRAVAVVVEQVEEDQQVEVAINLK